jgi:hypothetical protein
MHVNLRLAPIVSLPAGLPLFVAPRMLNRIIAI